MEPAALIRDARTRSKLTQTELARRLGMTQAAIGRLERRGANPTVATLERVLHATGHRLELSAAEQASSVDETLIASYLRLSPAERLEAFQTNHNSLARLKELAGTHA